MVGWNTLYPFNDKEGEEGEVRKVQKNFLSQSPSNAQTKSLSQAISGDGEKARETRCEILHGGLNAIFDISVTGHARGMCLGIVQMAL